jgi:hypothetical protein
MAKLSAKVKKYSISAQRRRGRGRGRRRRRRSEQKVQKTTHRLCF